MLELIAGYPDRQGAIRPVVSCQSRIKSAESMIKKLENRGIEKSLVSALSNVYDAVGIRIV